MMKTLILWIIGLTLLELTGCVSLGNIDDFRVTFPLGTETQDSQKVMATISALSRKYELTQKNEHQEVPSPDGGNYMAFYRNGPPYLYVVIYGGRNEDKSNYLVISVRTDPGTKDTRNAAYLSDLEREIRLTAEHTGIRLERYMRERNGWTEW